MLSSFPMNSKDQDTGRQMAAIRSYLATLKDELENDLNNIGYRNLDADLRGRFDDLTDSFFALQRQTDNVAEIVKAKYITADEIVAKYATISSLNAATARIGSLEADHVSTGSFNALVGSVNTLSAKAITTDNFTSQKITAGMINSGVISATKITTGTLTVDRLQGDNGANASWSQIEYIQSITSGAVGTHQATLTWVKRWVLAGTFVGSGQQIITIN